MLCIWIPSLNGFFLRQTLSRVGKNNYIARMITMENRTYSTKIPKLPNYDLDDQVAKHLESAEYDQLFSLLQTKGTHSKNVKDQIDQEFNLLYSKIEHALSQKLFGLSVSHDLPSLEKKIDKLLKSYMYLRTNRPTKGS
jgi:hypothetical protein